MSNSKKGKIIVIEGGEGAGKTSLIDKILKIHPKFIYTREPGGTKMGEIQREIFKVNVGNMAPEHQLSFIHNIRIGNIFDFFLPKLAEGETIIIDRFSMSTLAYQVDAIERFDLLPMFQTYSDMWEKHVQPFFILLDLPVSVGTNRVIKRAAEEGFSLKDDYHDSQSIEFHKKIRKSFLNSIRVHKANNRGAVVNAEQSPEKVLEDALKIIENA